MYKITMLLPYRSFESHRGSKIRQLCSVLHFNLKKTMNGVSGCETGSCSSSTVHYQIYLNKFVTTNDTVCVRIYWYIPACSRCSTVYRQFWPFFQVC